MRRYVVETFCVNGKTFLFLPEALVYRSLSFILLSLLFSSLRFFFLSYAIFSTGRSFSRLRRVPLNPSCALFLYYRVNSASPSASASRFHSCAVSLSLKSLYSSLGSVVSTCPFLVGCLFSLAPVALLWKCCVITLFSGPN